MLTVNLLDENGKFLWSGTIDEAKRYAKKHNMQLVNYEDAPTTTKALQMQLISIKKLVEDPNSPNETDVKKKETKKEQVVKKFTINDSTSDHDLEIKCKKIANFLYKNNKIRLVINGFKIDQKFSVLDKLKKKFAPHLAFKQVSSNPTSIKLYMVAEKSFAEFYENEFLKDQNEIDDLQTYKNDESEEDLLDEDELEHLVDEKLKK